MDRNIPASPMRDDVDVRKPSVRVSKAARGRSRRSLVATVELLSGLSKATAESLNTLSTALTPESVADHGLGNSILTGLRDGNARYFEELSKTSRRVFDALRAPRPDRVTEADADTVAHRLDYERLAELVAAQMREAGAAEP